MVASTCAPDTLDFGVSTYSTEDQDECIETYTTKQIQVLNNDPDGDSCATGACARVTDMVLGPNPYELVLSEDVLPSACGSTNDDDGSDIDVMQAPNVFKFVPATTGLYTFTTCE